MDSLSVHKTANFVKDVADFGQEISQILQNWETTRAKFDATSVKTLTQLNPCVQGLKQVYELLLKDDEHADGAKRFLTGDGRRYAQILARECAVAFECTVSTLLAGHRADAPNESPRFWPAPISQDADGVPKLQAKHLDEPKIFQMLDDMSKYTLRVNLEPATKRLNQLQVGLLLFVDVVNVGRITKQNTWAGVTAKEFVVYHARIRRSGKKMGVSNASGDVLARPKPMNKIYVSSDSSSSDSSDYDSDDSRPRPAVRRKKGWPQGAPPPPPPPGNLVGVNPVLPNIAPPAPAVPSFPPPGHVEEIEEVNDGDKVNPPSYVENSNSPAPTSDKKEDPTASPAEVPSKEGQAEKTKEPKVENASGSLPTEDARLLNSKSSGFLMKFKSVFRSKASLEAEMKQVLENSNASLSAFIINNFEYRKIPHSAFHSLEYTHMRTILSQLNDSSWFKTYSDLTDCEHDTLSAIVGKHYVDGETVQRELVALKVLRKNRVNAWMRLVEYAMRAHNFLPQFDNYRIVLAITREKKDTGAAQAKKARLPVVIVDDPNVEVLPRPPQPYSVFDENAARLFDLDGPIPAPRYPPSRNPWRAGPPGPLGPPHHPPPPGARPPPGWRPPPPPGQPNFWPPPPSPVSGTSDNAKKFDDKKLTKPAALKALTTYTAFTIRKAPPKTNNIPVGSLYYPAEIPWMRCLVTREAVSTPDLDRRVLEFKASGSSIIDMKFQLTDIQNSHLTILMNELTGDELNPHFEHTIVELSMVNRELGLLMHQQAFNAEIIHVIVRRAPKEGTDVVDLYKTLMSPPPPPPPPAGVPPFRPPGTVIVESVRRRPRRRVSVDTISIRSSSVSSRSSGSDVSDIEETRRVKRWEKDEDPIVLKFDKKFKGQDVVQCLLDRWTVGGEGEEKVSK